jgi:small subunit ribosomal protein S18
MDNNNVVEREQNTQRPARPMMRRKKKVCAFCADKIGHIDYKDTARLRKYVTERAKILPRRISGCCAKHQRELTIAIKRARHVALMPFSAD